jgi:two-component system OmpR family sensor kinase
MNVGRDSIARRLLLRLLSGCLLVGLVMAITVAALVARQTQELLDYQLEQVARVLIDHDFNRLNVPLVDDPAAHLDIQVLDREGRRIYRSGNEVDVPVDAPLGFSRQISRTDPDEDGVIDEVMLRVFTLRSEFRTVQVMQPWTLRQELAWEAGARLFLVAMAALAGLVLVALASVHGALKPLRQLHDELGQRGADSLAPIVLTDAPTDLQRPLLALNGLLARLDDSLQAHRHFIADAAHQLRTPLAAVRLQSDNLARTPEGPGREQAQLRLSQGLERLQRLVEQLLALARLEHRDTATVPQSCDLKEVATEALVGLALAAAQRGVELVFEADEAVPVPGAATEWRMLIDNLVDNAIKHGPRDSVVQLRVAQAQGQALLEVSDQGPGIAAADRQRVLQRFARGEGHGGGSGLGLAIVAEVARRQGATLALDEPPHGRGLRVRVTVPALPLQ